MVFNVKNTKASKLNGEQVLEMRRLRHFEGWTQMALAQRYKVSLSSVRNIVHGVTWQWLPNVRPDAPAFSRAADPLTRPEITDAEILASQARVFGAMEKAAQPPGPQPSAELLAKYGVKPR